MLAHNLPLCQSLGVSHSRVYYWPRRPESDRDVRTERVSRKPDATQDDSKAGVADYVERFYNPYRRYSTSDI